MIKITDTQNNSFLKIDDKPDVHEYTNAIYLPKKRNYDEKQGLYTQVGFLIQEAALYSQNPPRLKGHCNYIDPRLLAECDECDMAFYVGHADLHYGHTITEFMTRFWSIDTVDKNKIMFLIHSFHERKHLFSVKWFKDMIKLVGLEPENFVLPEEPCVIKKIIVPSPSFCEDNFVFSEFNKYMRVIGKSLIDQCVGLWPELIYISRSRLKSGSWHVANEKDLADFLGNRGFRIVFPEELDFDEQVRIFRPGNMVVGLLGSAFHTSVFGYGANIIALSAGPVSKNFFLMDHFGQNNVEYYNFDLVKLDDVNGFNSCFQIVDVKKLADSIFERCYEILKIHLHNKS